MLNKFGILIKLVRKWNVFCYIFLISYAPEKSCSNILLELNETLTCTENKGNVQLSTGNIEINVSLKFIKSIKIKSSSREKSVLI